MNAVRVIYLKPWRIDVAHRDAVEAPGGVRQLARAIAAALDVAGAPKPASIGLILSDDHELASLNAEHMGVAGPTDVLSFPLLPSEAFPDHPRRSSAGSSLAPPAPRGPGGFALPPRRRLHVGDIVVSVERAVEQAATGGGGWSGRTAWSAADELRLLVTHGTLHICGWDHAEPAEEAAMRRLEGELLGVEAR